MSNRRRVVWRGLKQHPQIGFANELSQWNLLPPVGREFGSPDFDRLMEEDHRDGTGVFDPSLKPGRD